MESNFHHIHETIKRSVRFMYIVVLLLMPMRVLGHAQGIAAGAAAPTITNVYQFEQQGIAGAGNDSLARTYVVQIVGQHFPTSQPTIIFFPSIKAAATILNSTPTQVVASFSAEQGYSIQQVALSFATGEVASLKPNCSQFLSMGQAISRSTFPFYRCVKGAAKTAYGAGVASNFRVIQLSVLNQCPLPVTIPLAGIELFATKLCGTTVKGVAPVISKSAISPSALDYITPFYNEDKQVMGRRALFFNSLSAAVTVGSVIQPFLPIGFTQGVAIAGGSFTTAAQHLYRDMSAQQLQALTGEAFGNAEQLAARNGSLRKYLFIPMVIQDKQLACALKEGNVGVRFIAIPTLTTGTAVASPVK